MRWPLNSSYEKRFFVPDLSPAARPELAKLKDFKPQIIFVAESPHEAEVTPEKIEARRPLCGRAGQVWWRMVTEIVTGEVKKEVSTDLENLLSLCRAGKFVVMNAVQYPLDPKIVAYQGMASDPIEGLGFTKVPPASFKKLRSTEAVQTAITRLRQRLVDPSVAQLPVVSLGNDAAWFITQALGEELAARHIATVPHPSAWWRQGGKLREKARELLTKLLVERKLKPQGRVRAQAELGI